MFAGPIKDDDAREQATRILEQLRGLAETWRGVRERSERAGKAEHAASCEIQIKRIEAQCEFLEAALKMPLD